MFHNEYKIFIENEEVLKSMTILDEKYAEGMEEGRLEGKKEGRLEGKEEGRLEGIAIGEAKAQAAYNTQLENILVTIMKNKEPYPFIKGLAADIGISDARLNELLAKNEFTAASPAAV
jgi:hypothetical protein